MYSHVKSSLACVAVVMVFGWEHLSPAPRYQAVAQVLDPPDDENQVDPQTYLNKESLLTYHRVISSPAWRKVILGAGRADVMMYHRFFSSFQYWRLAWLSTGTWTLVQQGDLKDPITLSGNSSILIEGDCLADITVPDHALIHILGDVNAKITVGEYSEVVVGGAITENGSIDGASISNVYVDGDMNGSINNVGYSWIAGNAKGVVVTASPSTRVHIGGDFLGLVSAGHKGLLSVSVEGYMPSETIYAIADLGYTQFNACVGLSDTTAGLYPALMDKDRDHAERLFSNQWVVLATVPADYVNRLKDSANR